MHFSSSTPSVKPSSVKGCPFLSPYQVEPLFLLWYKVTLYYVLCEVCDSLTLRSRPKGHPIPYLVHYFWLGSDLYRESCAIWASQIKTEDQYFRTKYASLKCVLFDFECYYFVYYSLSSQALSWVFYWSNTVVIVSFLGGGFLFSFKGFVCDLKRLKHVIAGSPLSGFTTLWGSV
jgi:hypothetical protein